MQAERCLIAVRHQDCKLVSSVAGAHVEHAHRRLDDFPNMFEDGIADLMSVGMVDGLEVVDIRHQYRKLGVFTVAAADFLMEGVSRKLRLSKPVTASTDAARSSRTMSAAKIRRRRWPRRRAHQSRAAQSGRWSRTRRRRAVR